MMRLTADYTRLLLKGQSTFPEEIFLETCFDDDALIDAR
jgi:hypothetical protein